MTELIYRLQRGGRGVLTSRHAAVVPPAGVMLRFVGAPAGAVAVFDMGDGCIRYRELDGDGCRLPEELSGAVTVAVAKTDTAGNPVREYLCDGLYVDRGDNVTCVSPDDGNLGDTVARMALDVDRLAGVAEELVAGYHALEEKLERMTEGYDTL